MSIHGVSTRRILVIVAAVVIGGVIIAGFFIAINPPTSTIPEPSFNYSTLNDLFLYYNDTQGGVVTNFLEFSISLDNYQDGGAFLRISSATITVWVADITTHQPNTSLMQYDPVSTEVRCNPSRDQNLLGVVDNNVTDGEWWATGTCQVVLRTNELFTNNVIIVDYGFMLSNDVAKACDGHQFLVRIHADITYSAFYCGGLFAWEYQSSTFNCTLGEDSPIYMSAIET
ncbi:MAG: hypothetical protein JW779_15080 [Candidatus Thorarchaeota archaeon]|nr:hypothetical protein [Candidatus Thorarchaeota archaeon]